MLMLTFYRSSTIPRRMTTVYIDNEVDVVELFPGTKKFIKMNAMKIFSSSGQSCYRECPVWPRWDDNVKGSAFFVSKLRTHGIVNDKAEYISTVRCVVNTAKKKITDAFKVCVKLKL